MNNRDAEGFLCGIIVYPIAHAFMGLGAVSMGRRILNSAGLSGYNVYDGWSAVLGGFIVGVATSFACVLRHCLKNSDRKGQDESCFNKRIWIFALPLVFTCSMAASGCIGPVEAPSMDPVHGILAGGLGGAIIGFGFILPFVCYRYYQSKSDPGSQSSA